MIGRDKELTREEIEFKLDRNHVTNVSNLTKLTTGIGSYMFNRFGTRVGFYVVGSFTHQDVETRKPVDINLIAASADQESLDSFTNIPMVFKNDNTGEFLYSSRFTVNFLAALKVIKDIKFFGMHIGSKYWCRPDESHYERIGPANRIGQAIKGRPHLKVFFNDGQPISVCALYYDPLTFKIGADAREQYTFDRAVAVERKEKMPFAIWQTPRS